MSTNSFTVSGDSIAENQLDGAPITSGADCQYDFVIIPDGYFNGVAANADRFCGNTLATITSKWLDQQYFID